MPFDSVGDYLLTISLPSSSFRDERGQPVPVSAHQTMRLNIGGPDAARLSDACRDLARTASTARGAQAQMDAARALASISDPVTVPYLREVLQATRNLDWIVLPGLVRIGAPAGSVLLEMSQSPDPERAAMALDALRRLPKAP